MVQPGGIYLVSIRTLGRDSGANAVAVVIDQRSDLIDLGFFLRQRDFVEHVDALASDGELVAAWLGISSIGEREMVLSLDSNDLVHGEALRGD